MIKNNKGFSLLELLVAITILTVVTIVAYSSFASQNRSYLIQEEVAEMQQNLRAAMGYMTREIRMATANPKSILGLTEFVVADANTLHFTLDIGGGESDGVDNDDDGLIDCNDPATDCDDPDEEFYADGSIDDPNEDITYTLYDAYGDGDTDIGRNTGGVNQPLAENIDVLNFVYLDGNGAVLPTPVSPANLTAIRTIEITIIARASRPDFNFTDTSTVYTNLQGDTLLDMATEGSTLITSAAGAVESRRFRRRILRSTIRCRNLI